MNRTLYAVRLYRPRAEILNRKMEIPRTTAGQLRS